MERWTEPPVVVAPKQIRAVLDPRERADLANAVLRDLDEYRDWLVRARAEAIAAAYARGISYADLGQRWGVGGERVRQMMFQSGDGRSGWRAGQDIRPKGLHATPRPLPIGLVHAVEQGNSKSACGIHPVHDLGSDFTSTVYPACPKCQKIVTKSLEN